MRTTRRDFVKTVSAAAAGSLLRVPTAPRPAITKGLVFDMVTGDASYADKFKIVRDAGFEPVIVGKLADASRFQQGGPGYGQNVTAAELRKTLSLP